MKNEKTIKLDFTRHFEKAKNRPSKEVGRMKKTFSELPDGTFIFENTYSCHFEQILIQISK